MNECSIRLYFILIAALLSLNTYANEQETDIETLDEVSIVGNSELPSLDFNLTWRLPSIEKRDNQSMPTDIQGVLSPLEPKRQQQRIHFSRFLEVDTPRFKPQ